MRLHIQISPIVLCLLPLHRLANFDQSSMSTCLSFILISQYIFFSFFICSNKKNYNKVVKCYTHPVKWSLFILFLFLYSLFIFFENQLLLVKVIVLFRYFVSYILLPVMFLWILKVIERNLIFEIKCDEQNFRIIFTM